MIMKTSSLAGQPFTFEPLPPAGLKGEGGLACETRKQAGDADLFCVYS